MEAVLTILSTFVVQVGFCVFCFFNCKENLVE